MLDLLQLAGYCEVTMPPLVTLAFGLTAHLYPPDKHGCLQRLLLFCVTHHFHLSFMLCSSAHMANATRDSSRVLKAEMPSRCNLTYTALQVLEETGFDVGSRLKSNDYIEIHMQEKRCRLYIIQRVSTAIIPIQTVQHLR